MLMRLPCSHMPGRVRHIPLRCWSRPRVCLLARLGSRGRTHDDVWSRTLSRRRVLRHLRRLDEVCVGGLAKGRLEKERTGEERVPQVHAFGRKDPRIAREEEVLRILCSGARGKGARATARRAERQAQRTEGNGQRRVEKAKRCVSSPADRRIRFSCCVVLVQRLPRLPDHRRAATRKP